MKLPKEGDLSQFKVISMMVVCTVLGAITMVLKTTE